MRHMVKGTDSLSSKSNFVQTIFFYQAKVFKTFFLANFSLKNFVLTLRVRQTLF
jgi:hypothetical protein